MANLSEMVTRLRIDLRDITMSLFNDIELEQHVLEGIRDYGKRRPMRARISLIVIEGLKEYELPSNCLVVESLTNTSGYEVSYEVFEDRLILPDITNFSGEVLELRYTTLYSVENLPALAEDRVLLYAQAKVNQTLANETAKYFDFNTGDGKQIDKGDLSKKYLELFQVQMAAYEKSMRQAYADRGESPTPIAYESRSED